MTCTALGCMAPTGPPSATREGRLRVAEAERRDTEKSRRTAADSLRMAERRECVDPRRHQVSRNRGSATERSRRKASRRGKMEESSGGMAGRGRGVAVQDRRGGSHPTRRLSVDSEVAAASRGLAKDGREFSLRRSLPSTRVGGQEMRRGHYAEEEVKPSPARALRAHGRFFGVDDLSAHECECANASRERVSWLVFFFMKIIESLLFVPYLLTLFD